MSDLMKLTPLNTDTSEEMKFKVDKLIEISCYYVFSFFADELTKAQRFSIHSTVGESFFHFTIKGRLYLSNCDENKSLYEKYKMKNYTFEDKIDTRINELDSPLNDLSVGNLKKTKINLEKSSLKSTLSVSTQFKEVVA
jgi:hypothetical protein